MFNLSIFHLNHKLHFGSTQVMFNTRFWCRLSNRKVRNVATQKRPAVQSNCPTQAAAAWKSSSRGTAGPARTGDAAGLTGPRRHLSASDAEMARSSAGWWWWSSLASVPKTAPAAAKRQLPPTDCLMTSTNWRSSELKRTTRPLKRWLRLRLRLAVLRLQTSVGWISRTLIVHDFAS